MPSAWQIHLTKFRSAHPNLSLKEAMQGASKTYRGKTTPKKAIVSKSYRGRYRRGCSHDVAGMTVKAKFIARKLGEPVFGMRPPVDLRVFTIYLDSNETYFVQYGEDLMMDTALCSGLFKVEKENNTDYAICVTICEFDPNSTYTPYGPPPFFESKDTLTLGGIVILKEGFHFLEAV